MMKKIFSILVATLLLAPASAAMAQKSGQSMQIQYGVVIDSTFVQERSDAGKAALVGGAIGYGLTRNKSRTTKAAASVAGAGLAGAAKNRSEGSREARQYTVKTTSGTVVIISDQTEIHVDDCVIVENPGNSNANIRRVDPTFCDPASAEVVAELQDEVMEEALECAAAKRELAEADSDASFDRALRKVEILCNM
jgi:ABC-type oligopeptide transport system substrate-binding subunit